MLVDEIDADWDLEKRQNWKIGLLKWQIIIFSLGFELWTARCFSQQSG